MTPGPGIEPGTHWWEPSAITTLPFQLPFFRNSGNCCPIHQWNFPTFKPEILVEWRAPRNLKNIGFSENKWTVLKKEWDCTLSTVKLVNSQKSINYIIPYWGTKEGHPNFPHQSVIHLHPKKQQQQQRKTAFNHFSQILSILFMIRIGGVCSKNFN